MNSKETTKEFIVRLFVVVIVSIIILGLLTITSESKKQETKKEEILRDKTVKYVFKDETYCEIYVITSDLPEDSVIKMVNKLYPDESELVLMNKIEVPITSVE